MADNRSLFYEYIVRCNPDIVKEICSKYGYTVPPVKNFYQLGDLLNQLVMIEGERAFDDIIKKHPDYDRIIERYIAEKEIVGTHVGCDGCKSTAASPCKCGGKCGQKSEDVDLSNVKLQTVSQVQQNTAAVQQIHGYYSGTIILSCAVIVALAIMSKK